MGMFTIHLESQKGEPACGAFSEHMSQDSKEVDCKECLQARIEAINQELREMDELDRKMKEGEL